MHYSVTLMCQYVSAEFLIDNKTTINGIKFNIACFFRAPYLVMCMFNVEGYRFGKDEKA